MPRMTFRNILHGLKSTQVRMNKNQRKNLLYLLFKFSFDKLGSQGKIDTTLPAMMI